ncbi:MAG: MBL fold metallo-hydrolase [Gemmatimonadetes bacterium]|mgnify:CR=1 FL=1|jgi:L-ascorbate metabolism protein UlaG (beta-lactamase superfamily)|nr:MBL fold metallo-hydrolase [Gemmatimonadota bacterium]MBT6148065.1 MBL fold metallo-hydrolase [Gemmatimonadota bacterium]MBT7861900.1 MBL fold metallo-hydrolase [Gemmatimonadota bacterium]
MGTRLAIGCILLGLLAGPGMAGVTDVLLQRQHAVDLRLGGLSLVTADGYSGYRPQPAVVSPAGVQIQYLGTGGLLIERGDAAILTAPYFANNSLFRVGMWCLAPRNELVDRYLPDLSRVQAILVGHAHYDHLLDLPYVWQAHARHTTVYGNRSMVNLLHGARPRPAMVDIEVDRRTATTSGTYRQTHDGSIRFLPIASSHAPNVAFPPNPHGFSAMVSPWSVEEPLDRLPGRSRHWRLGETLAYVIELNGGPGSRPFRIYYQDAGHIPEDWHHPGDGDIDLAILTVASTNLIGQRELIDRIEEVISPRHWMLIHWEDFFHTYSQDPEQMYTVPYTNPEDFVRHLRSAGIRDGSWVLPTPGTMLRY